MDPLAEAHARITKLETAVTKLCDILMMQYHVTGPTPSRCRHRMVELIKKEVKS